MSAIDTLKSQLIDTSDAGIANALQFGLDHNLFPACRGFAYSFLYVPYQRVEHFYWGSLKEKVNVQ